MSHHMDERNTPALDDLLRQHRLAADKPSQLSDAFRLGYWSAQAEIARLQAEVERLRKAKTDCLRLLITARRDARNDALEEAAQAILGKLYLLSIVTPEEGPFTRQDRTRDEVIEQAVAAIRDLKSKETT